MKVRHQFYHEYALKSIIIVGKLNTNTMGNKLLSVTNKFNFNTCMHT